MSEENRPEEVEIPDSLGPDEPEIEDEGGDDPFPTPIARCPVCEAVAVLPKDEDVVWCLICKAEWDDPAEFRADLKKSRGHKIDLQRAFLYLVKNGFRIAADFGQLLKTQPAKDLGDIFRGLFD